MNSIQQRTGEARESMSRIMRRSWGLFACSAAPTAGVDAGVVSGEHDPANAVGLVGGGVVADRVNRAVVFGTELVAYVLRRELCRDVLDRGVVLIDWPGEIVGELVQESQGCSVASSFGVEDARDGQSCR